MKEQETRINDANADLDTKLKELDVKLQLLEKGPQIQPVVLWFS